MRIKASIFCLLLAGSVSASQSGFYAGGKLGMESVSSKLEYSTLAADSVGNEGNVFSLFIGYNMPISDDLYWGVEAEYLSHDTDIMYKYNSFEEEISFGNEYSASLLLGSAYSDNVNIFGRLGASRAKSEGKTSDGDSGDDEVNGWLVGVGTEFKNSSPISVRAEYRYSKYKEIDFNYGASVDNSPKSHSFSVSGVYSF